MSQSTKHQSKHATGHGPAKIRFWGVRGSIPVPGPQTVKYGGNTSCVEVRADGHTIILDAGTGLRALGNALESETHGQPLDLTILVTHMHWDHIQGLPFFSPAYGPQNRIRVHGFTEAGRGFLEIFSRQMEAPYFPITLSAMQGIVVFEELGADTFQVGSIRVSSCRTRHPGLCHAYRLDTGAGSICYIPDHEVGSVNATPDNEAVAKLIQGADLVILDAQYTAEEYSGFEGRGHSSMEDAVRFARDARAKRLHLFHHDPSHDDDFLDRMLQKARHIAAGSGMRIESAREGEQVTLAAK